MRSILDLVSSGLTLVCSIGALQAQSPPQSSTYSESREKRWLTNYYGKTLSSLGEIVNLRVHRETGGVSTAGTKWTHGDLWRLIEHSEIQDYFSMSVAIGVQPMFSIEYADGLCVGASRYTASLTFPDGRHGLVVLSPDRTGRANHVAPSLSLAEQEVIEALLLQETETGAYQRHVIAQTTSVRKLFPRGLHYASVSQSLRDQGKERDVSFRETIDDFLMKNRVSIKLVFPTNALESVELVSDASIEETFSVKPDAKPNGWDLFYRRFPDAGGLITLSRAGFDSTGTVAMIYLGMESDYHVGSGRIRVLKRQTGRWILDKYDRIGPGWVL